MSHKRKKQITAMLLDPNGPSIKDLALSENIGLTTLYNWRNQALAASSTPIASSSSSTGIPSHVKLKALLETANFNESQIAEYCRKNGFYPEQLPQWHQELSSRETAPTAQITNLKQSERALSAQVRKLEAEIKRKDKALAEAAALLVLSKKVQAIWGEEDA